MTPLYVIELHNAPIFEQLHLEEALVRTDKRNVCLINMGSPRAIVLGLSGDPEELLHSAHVQEERIPVLRRFSGGGCVVVDEQTLFISFLFNKEDLPITPFPEPILRWASDLYREAWQLDQFRLVENDFALGEKKCGGNAQYIQKERWLLHTSFLWDFEQSNMNALILPRKRPSYRRDRPHEEFLCRLKNHAPSPSSLIAALKKSLLAQFTLLPFPEQEFPQIRQREHRKATVRI